MIYVTHDQVEAMTLADRIVVLDAGRVIQVGTPRDLYNHPANTFVAQFIGSPKMNIVPCTVESDRYTLLGGRGGRCSANMSRATQLGIRAEHMQLVALGEGECDGLIEVVEYLGADTFVLLNCGDLGTLSVRLPGETDYQPGTEVGLSFDVNHVRFFDENGNAVN